jgi:hypothetical protein
MPGSQRRSMIQGEDRGKSKEEKEVKTECSCFLDEPRLDRLVNDLDFC